MNKKGTSAMVILSVIAIALFVVVTSASAGGVINHKITSGTRRTGRRRSR